MLEHSSRYRRPASLSGVATLLLFAVLASPVVSNAATNQTADKRLKLFGDFRLRLEQDWDSLKGDGTSRDDRLRMRIRLRVGVDLTINDQFSARLAARTGPRLSQQSPHITIYDFDGGDTGPYQGSLDHWYVQYESESFDAWVGRNELSFWHQDELFVFDNVTFPGAGASYRHALGAAKMTWHLNYVALPVGMTDTSGTAVLGQVVYDREFAESAFTVSAAYENSNADPDNPAGEILLTENNTRDYRVVDLTFQYRNELFGKPFLTGLDLARNFKDYANAPAGSFSKFHQDDTDKYVLEFRWGSVQKKGDWRFSYYYSYLEALSVNSSYIADDWVRWGNSTQVRATNLKGSEFRARYTIGPNMNIIARLFFVDAIDLLEPGDTTLETGNRLRIDYNVSF